VFFDLSNYYNFFLSYLVLLLYCLREKERERERERGREREIIKVYTKYTNNKTNMAETNIFN